MVTTFHNVVLTVASSQPQSRDWGAILPLSSVDFQSPNQAVVFQVLNSICPIHRSVYHPSSSSNSSSSSSFSSQLHAVAATLRLGGYEKELESTTTLSQLEAKLPPFLRSQWGRASYNIKNRLPDVTDLDFWSYDVTAGESCVQVHSGSTAFNEKGPFTGQRSKNRGPQVFRTADFIPCPCRSGQHELKKC